MSAQTPRPYQLDHVERLSAAARAGHRVIVAQAATGSGKTTTATIIAQRALARGKRTLFLVHRRKLVVQISGRLADQGIHHGVLMRGEYWDKSHGVHVASRDTLLSRCVRNEWHDMPEAQLVIVDEAHHAAKADSEYRRILDAYPQATIILLTATPVGPDGTGLGPWATALECAAPTSRLVQDGHLCPVKIFAPERSNDDARGLAGDLVASWDRYGDQRPTVLFTGRVQHSKDAVDEFVRAGIPAAHMDAATPDDRRDEIFDWIRSGRIKVLCNVGIVGEGVDVPELGCCQIYREVSGRVQWMQMIGRVMRPAPGKTHGIVIDHSGAVFRHGFPDEDTEWTLEGDTDAKYKSKHDKGDTDAANYCKKCELVYPRSSKCPQCGSVKTKPPRSVFSPPPINDPNAVLTEAERHEQAKIWSIDEKRAHWKRCQKIGQSRGGGDRQAAAIWKKKYGSYPTLEVTSHAGSATATPDAAYSQT
jgi:superfamily II DNA or RNA helicase